LGLIRLNIGLWKNKKSDTYSSVRVFIGHRFRLLLEPVGYVEIGNESTVGFSAAGSRFGRIVRRCVGKARIRNITMPSLAGTGLCVMSVQGTTGSRDGADQWANRVVKR